MAATKNNHQYINDDKVVNLILTLGENDTDQLCQVLSQNRSLKSVKVTGTLLLLKKVIPVLAKIPTLEELSIKCNECASSLLGHLIKCPKLRWISFTTFIDYSFAHSLTNFLKADPPVQEIVIDPLSGNILTDYHYSIITEGVKLNTHLRSLKGYYHVHRRGVEYDKIDDLLAARGADVPEVKDNEEMKDD